MRRAVVLAGMLAVLASGCSNDNREFTGATAGPAGGREVGGGFGGGTFVPPPQVTPTTVGATRFLFTDISETGQGLNPGDDETVQVQLPFSFPFRGQTFATVGVCSNGFLTLGTEASFANTPLPSELGPSPLLAVYWDDLSPPAGGGNWIFTQVFGAAPNRQFIVQWNNAASPMETPDGITFQVVLNENGTAELQYRDTIFGDTEFDEGASATVGFQGPGAAFQFCFNQAGRVPNGTGLLIQ